MNCKPGDLAICISTELPENNGLIVRVIRRHQNNLVWDFGSVPSWWCTSDAPMTWHFRHQGKKVQAHQGPVPDAVLRPIRPDRQPEVERKEEEVFAAA